MPRRLTRIRPVAWAGQRPPAKQSVRRATWLSALFAIVILCATAVFLPHWARAQPSTLPEGRVALVVQIKGAIGPATTELLRQALATAGPRNAAVIVLEMDTPGGLSSSMRDIIQDILASSVPVFTFVSPSGARAASAGTYILYASHIAAMAPSTNLGAATPVQIGGGWPGTPDKEKKPDEPDPQTAKAVNDAAAYIRGLALLRGRNVEWAEEAVRKAASLSAREALERGVIDFVAADIGDLLAKADGRKVSVGGNEVMLKTAGLQTVVLEPGWASRILAIITDPNIAYLLLLIGIYGILFEFMNPGAVVPGVVGAIALLVGLFSLNLLPISYAGMGLLILGIGLMVAEAFAPSFGILGIGGIVAFALGSLFLFKEVPGFEISLPVVLTATGLSFAFLVLVLAVGIRAHRHRTVSGAEAMIGEPGKVLAWAGGGGDVHVHGERWQARAASSSAGPFAPGTRVRVTGRDRLTLLVEPEKPPEA